MVLWDSRSPFWSTRSSVFSSAVCCSTWAGGMAQAFHVREKSDAEASPTPVANATRTDTSLIAIFSSLACVASISQQIHYATRWESIKQAEYAAKVLDPYNPILVVTGATQGVDLGLFWIQFTTYNINSLLILFWYVQPLSAPVPHRGVPTHTADTQRAGPPPYSWEPGSSSSTPTSNTGPPATSSRGSSSPSSSPPCSSASRISRPFRADPSHTCSCATSPVS